MSGSIRTNIGALTALNQIALTAAGLNTSGSQLSTGLSINSPEDDPAGYITAHGFTSEIGGMSQAISNANEGISLAQTAQAAIQQQIGIAQNLYAIAIQAATGTETTNERQSLQGIAETLIGSINSIASQTQYNGINLLNGSFRGMQFQTGANAGQNSALSIDSTMSSMLGTNNGFSLSRVTYSFLGQSKEFSSGSIVINGPNGRSAPIMVTKDESAYSLVQSINQYSAQTGVHGSASNSIQLHFSSSSLNGGAYKKWGAGLSSSSGSTSAAQFSKGNINPKSGSGATAASAAQEFAKEINNFTGGVPGGADPLNLHATVTSSGLLLSQASGKNIVFGNAANSNTNDIYTSSGMSIQNGVSPAIIHGTFNLTSNGQFTITNGWRIGSGSRPPQSPHASALSNINLGTASGAEKAIKVIQGAITQLSTIAGNVGAFQDGLSVLSGNLSVTSANASQALGVVQDANIPAQTGLMTEDEIKAQSGVAALKNSTSLQESFLSLLP